MKIESKFKEGNATYVVQRYPNGKYYNSEVNESSTYSNVGPFDTLQQAEKMLMQHRPYAKKQPIKNTYRKKVQSRAVGLNSKKKTKPVKIQIDELEESLDPDSIEYIGYFG